MPAPQHSAVTIDNGINVTKCHQAINRMATDEPTLGLVANVARNCIDAGRGDQGERCETALTYLLGAYDALSASSLRHAAVRVHVCRQELKALIPGRLR
jgi:hypothetical protein